MKHRIYTFFSFLKKLFRNKDSKPFYSPYSKAEKKVFDAVEVGDLVYCQMPLSEEKLAGVPEGHKERPYVIVDKDEHFLYGYYCTSQVQNNWNAMYVIYPNEDRICDSFYKKTYVLFKEMVRIPIVNVRYVMFHLENYEIFQIARRIALKEKNTEKEIRNFKGMDDALIPIKEGDILVKDGQYYYLKEWNKSCSTVYKINKHGVCLKRPGRSFFVDVSEQYYISNLSIRDIFWISNPNEVNIIKQAAHNQKHLKPQKTNKMKNKPIYYRKTGTILKQKYSEEEVIYLFNIKKNCYCYDMESDCIVTIHYSSFIWNGMLEKNDTLELLTELMEHHTKWQPLFQNAYNRVQNQIQLAIPNKNAENSEHSLCTL